MENVFKYKIYIVILMVISLFLLLIGTHFYLERNTRIANYTKLAEGLIILTETHITDHGFSWDVSPDAPKDYIEDLNHVYTMLENSFHISDFIIFDTNGFITFWGQKDIRKRNNWDFKDIRNLDGKSTLINVRNESIFSKLSPMVEAYTPIHNNGGDILGYAYFLFETSNRDIVYLVYFDFFFLGIIIILAILLFVLLFYIQKYEFENKENLNQKIFMTDIFNITKAGIIVLDKEKKIKYMNSELEELLGIKKEEFVETQICKDILCCTIERTGESKNHECPLELLNSQNKITYEFKVVRNNEILHLSAAVSRLYNQKIKEYESVMVIHDETAKKQEQLKLESLEEFENILNTSSLDINHLVSFIFRKMQELTECSEFLLFEGKTIETLQIIGYEELKGDVAIDLLACQDLIAEIYDKEILIERTVNCKSTTKKTKIIGLPFKVKDEMVGIALLIFGEKQNFEPRTKVLLNQLSKDIAVLIRVYKLVLDKEAQNQLLEKIYQLNVKLQMEQSNPYISEAVLLNTKELLNADIVALWRQENGWEGIVGECKKTHFHNETDFMKLALSSGEALIINSYEESREYPLLKKEGIETAYIKPIISNGVFLGGILFGFRQHKEIDEQFRKVGRMIKMLFTIFLENKKLNQSIESNATIIERARLSREIHDGVAQTIGFINIQMHRLKKIITNNENDKALNEIEFINQAVEQSYIELRESIDNLRTSDKNNSFIDWLEYFVDDFKKKHNMKISIEYSYVPLQLTEKEQTQLIRVFQEIFNNIRKHSNATDVSISLENNETIRRIIIKDNGIGFDTSNYEMTRYSGRGLKILKERLEEVNGHLTLTSAKNKGTTIEISF